MRRSLVAANEASTAILGEATSTDVPKIVAIQMPLSAPKAHIAAPAMSPNIPGLEEQ